MGRRGYYIFLGGVVGRCRGVIEEKIYLQILDLQRLASLELVNISKIINSWHALIFIIK